MKKFVFVLVVILSTQFYSLKGQVAINVNGINPDPSSMLDVTSNSKGVLIPRITLEQRAEIANPAEGLIVYCTNCGQGCTPTISVYILGVWRNLLYCTTPVSAIEGTHFASTTQIVWNWIAVSGALGYKWNTTNNYSTATDMGAATTKIETDLNCGTTYTRYVWAYDNCGASIATTLTQATIWCCGAPLTDSRDGKTYNTVVIGTQCWLKENMAVGTMVNGSQNQANNGIIEKYCYNDLQSNCDLYGGLYQWGELVQYINGASNTTSWNPVPSGNIQGICPTGWHIPKDSEWSQLISFLGGESIAGGTMKEAGILHWASPNTGATNSSGFTLLPSGSCFSGSFAGLTLQINLWSSTEDISSRAWHRNVYYNATNVGHGNSPKIYGSSARCLKD